jgi:hypothetical protein
MRGPCNKCAHYVFTGTRDQHGKEVKSCTRHPPQVVLVPQQASALDPKQMRLIPMNVLPSPQPDHSCGDYEPEVAVPTNRAEMRRQER